MVNKEDNPSFEPEKWNNSRIQASTNCYAYACNDPEGHVMGCFPLPGETMQTPIDVISTKEVTRGAIEDGLIKTDSPVQKAGYYLVALAIYPGRDFHWLRQDNDGTWSHKRGASIAENKDLSGKPINNPEEADLGPYKEFGGYFHVPKGGLRVGQKAINYGKIMEKEKTEKAINAAKKAENDNKTQEQKMADSEAFIRQFEMMAKGLSR